jgi:hypothetical protein
MRSSSSSPTHRHSAAGVRGVEQRVLRLVARSVAGVGPGGKRHGSQGKAGGRKKEERGKDLKHENQMNKLKRANCGRFFSWGAGCGAAQRQAAHAAAVMLIDVRSAIYHQPHNHHTHTSRLEGVPQYFPLKFKPVVGSKKWLARIAAAFFAVALRGRGYRSILIQNT